MAYDMFIGLDGLEAGPVPMGQVVMLVRMLPHLSTALTLYEANEELSYNALRVICRLSLSKEGVNELLAHPCCKETIIPYTMHFVNLKNTDLVDPAKKIITNTSAELDGRSMLIEEPRPVPGNYPADMVLDMLHVLSVDLHSASPSKVLDAVTALYNLAESSIFFEWVAASPPSTFQLLVLGAVKRVSDKGAQVAERATSLFCKIASQEPLQFRLQETQFEDEIKVVFMTLVLLMNMARSSLEKQPNAEAACKILCKWTFRLSGITAFWDSRVNIAQLISGCSHLVEELTKESVISDLTVIGSVASILDNLSTHTDFCQWVSVRPDVLASIVKMCLHLVRTELDSQEEIQGAGLEVIRTYTSIKAIRVGMLDSIRPHPDTLLKVMSGLIVNSEKNTDLLANSLQGFFTLLNCEAWDFTMTSWLAKIIAFPEGKSFLTALLLYTTYDDEAVAKFSIDIISSMVLKGGLDVFTDKDSKLILLDGLKRLLSEMREKEVSEQATILLTVVMSWPNCMEVVTKSLVSDELNETSILSLAEGQFERTMIGLALVLSDRNQVGVDCALVMLTNVLTHNIREFANLESEVHHSLLCALHNGPCLQEPQARVFTLKLLDMMTENDRLAEGLVAWLTAENPQSRARLLVYLCDLIEGDRDCDYEVTKKATNLLHLFVELMGENLFDYPVALECAFNSILATLESSNPRKHTMEELFCMMAESWMVPHINRHVFGGVYLQLVQLLFAPKSRKAALNTLTKAVVSEEWKTAHLAWIDAQSDTHVSTLLFLVSFMMNHTDDDEETIPVVTTLIKLHSTKTGMTKICDKGNWKYHEKVFAGFVAMLCGEAHADARQVAADGVRRFLQGVRTDFIGGRFLKLLLMGIMALQSDLDANKLRDPEAEARGMGEGMALLAEKMVDLTTLASQLVVLLLKRKPLHLMEEDTMEIAVMCLSWSLRRTEHDTFKLAAEALVNIFSFDNMEATKDEEAVLALTDGTTEGEAPGADITNADKEAAEEMAAKEKVARDLDVFVLPAGVLQILMDELRSLCERPEEEYSNAGIITVMSLGTHPKFLQLPLINLYPLLTIIRKEMRSPEVYRRTIASELLTNLASSDQLASLPEEAVSMLLAALSATVVSDNTDLAAYAAKTTKQVSERLTSTKNVPNSVLAELATGMQNRDEKQAMGAIEGLIRICTQMTINGVDIQVMEACVFGMTGLMEVETHSRECTEAATMALGCFALNAAGNPDCGSIFQVILQVFFRIVCSSEHRHVKVAVVEVANLCDCELWKAHLKMHLQSPQMDHRRLVATMSVLAEDETNEHLATCAHTILSFAIKMLLPLPAANVLLNTSAVALLAEELRPCKHTSAAVHHMRLLREWMEVEGAERLLDAKKDTVLDVLSALLPMLCSENDTLQTMAKELTNICLETEALAKIILKALAGGAADRLPDVFPVVLYMYLTKYRVESFLVLNPHLLAKLGLVLMDYLQLEGGEKSTLARKLMQKLMRTGAGAAYCMEILIGGQTVLTSTTSTELLTLYIEQQGCADIIFDPDMFLRVVRTLGRASMSGSMQGAMAQKCVAIMRREGLSGGFSLACIQHLITDDDAVLSGVSGQVLESWLSSEDHARKANKLPLETVEQLKKDLLRWAMMVSDPYQKDNVARVASTLTVSREVMKRCIPTWVLSTIPSVAIMALHGLLGWLKNNTVKQLLEYHDELMPEVTKSINYYAGDIEYTQVAIKFLEIILADPAGRHYLGTEMEDADCVRFLENIATLMLVDDKNLGHQVTKMLQGGSWLTFLLRAVAWHTEAEEEEEGEEKKEEPAAISFGAFLGTFFGAAPDPAPLISNRSIVKKRKGFLTKAKAHTILVDLLNAGRVRMHAVDPDVSGSALELLGSLCELDPAWVMLLVTLEGFSMDLARMVDVLANSKREADVSYVLAIVMSLTATATGRATLSKMLHEDKAVMLLQGLDVRTREGKGEIAEVANQAFFNLTMEGDSTWQYWLSQLDPAFLKMQSKMQQEKDKMRTALTSMTKEMMVQKRKDLAKALLIEQREAKDKREGLKRPQEDF